MSVDLPAPFGPMQAFGCCQTVPVVGWTSPVRHLMSVDLPAPFGPMQATRDESDTCTVAFSMVTLSLRGYLKDTSTTLMRALPLDFTPSIGRGFGKWNLSLFDLSSK